MEPVKQPEMLKKNTSSGLFNIFIVIGAILALLWLLYLTNLPLLFGLGVENPVDVGSKCALGLDYVVKEIAVDGGGFESKAFCSSLSSFQQKIGPAVFVLTIIFLVSLVANFYFKDKKLEWNKEEAGAIILKSDSELNILIRNEAKVHYGLNLGRFLRSWPIQGYTQQQALSPVYYYLYENLDSGRIVSVSRWYVNLAKKITFHLADREYLGFADKKHFWTGEPKQEINSMDFNNSLGLKRAKEINATESEPESGSMTE